MKENYFLTLWNFTYLKDTSFGIKSCNFEHGLETKNEFEKWPLITFFQCTYLKQCNKRMPSNARGKPTGSKKSHYENTPMQYTEIFSAMKIKISREKF